MPELTNGDTSFTVRLTLQRSGEEPVEITLGTYTFDTPVQPVPLPANARVQGPFIVDVPAGNGPITVANPAPGNVPTAILIPFTTAVPTRADRQDGAPQHGVPNGVQNGVQHPAQEAVSEAPTASTAAPLRDSASQTPSCCNARAEGRMSRSLPRNFPGAVVRVPPQNPRRFHGRSYAEAVAASHEIERRFAEEATAIAASAAPGNASAAVSEVGDSGSRGEDFGSDDQSESDAVNANDEKTCEKKGNEDDEKEDSTTEQEADKASEDSHDGNKDSKAATGSDEAPQNSQVAKKCDDQGHKDDTEDEKDEKESENDATGADGAQEEGADAEDVALSEGSPCQGMTSPTAPSVQIWLTEGSSATALEAASSNESDCTRNCDCPDDEGNDTAPSCYDGGVSNR